MAKRESTYWNLYDFIQQKYGVYLCEEEFRKLPAKEQRKYYFDYRRFIDNYTKGGKKE